MPEHQIRAPSVSDGSTTACDYCAESTVEHALPAPEVDPRKTSFAHRDKTVPQASKPEPQNTQKQGGGSHDLDRGRCVSFAAFAPFAVGIGNREWCEYCDWRGPLNALSATVAVRRPTLAPSLQRFLTFRAKVPIRTTVVVSAPLRETIVSHHWLSAIGRRARDQSARRRPRSFLGPWDLI